MNAIEKNLPGRKLAFLSDAFDQNENFAKSQRALLDTRRRILKKIMASLQKKALK